MNFRRPHRLLHLTRAVSRLPRHRHHAPQRRRLSRHDRRPPPMEDFNMGGASVKLFLPIFKMNFPEIVDIALPAEGVFHNLVFVSIKKSYPMQAYKIMHGLWGMGQMMFTKYIVVAYDGQHTRGLRHRIR